GVGDEHGGEVLEQGGGRRLGGDRPLQGAFEGISEEIDEGLTGGEAFLDGGLGEVEAELGGGEVEVGPAGVGVAQEGGGDHEQQRAAGGDAVAGDGLAGTGDLVEFVTQARLEVDGHRLYNVHGKLLDARVVGSNTCWRRNFPPYSYILPLSCAYGAIRCSPRPPASAAP